MKNTNAMTKNIVYLRVSTKEQSFDQQKHTVDTYCRQNGIDPDMTFTEKEHGWVSFEDRVLLDVLNIAKKGDRIICSEVSRITRDGFDELFPIKNICRKKGCTIYCVKENMHIGTDHAQDTAAETVSIITMAVVAEAARAERNNISARTKSCFSAIKETIEKEGFYTTKKRKLQITRLGDPDPQHLYQSAQKANIASCQARVEKKRADVEAKKAYYAALPLWEQKKSVREIAGALNNAGFRAPRGGQFLPSHINRMMRKGKQYWGGAERVKEIEKEPC